LVARLELDLGNIAQGILTPILVFLLPSHVHQFVRQKPRLSDPGSRVGTKIADENRTKLGELIGTVGARLLYEYDFGDGWQHELLLEEVLLGDETIQQTCVAGKRCCAPEDCVSRPGSAVRAK